MDKIKLLVVDDEQGIVDGIKRYYLEKGLETFGATDGVVAVEIFKKERPHIVIIDVHMPFSKIDGVEVLRQIKEMDKKAVCLMVSRIDDEDKIASSKKFGALHYIPKPLSMDDLDIGVDEAVDIVNKRKK